MNQKIYIINKNNNSLFCVEINNPIDINGIVHIIYEYFLTTKCINTASLLIDCGNYGDFLISPIPKTSNELNEKLTNLLDRH